MQLAHCLITNGNGHITFADRLIRVWMPHCRIIDKVTTFYEPKIGTHYLPHTGKMVTTAEDTMKNLGLYLIASITDF